MTDTAEVKPELVRVWPEAGRRLGFRSKSATYDAIAKGQIPVKRFGRRMMVAEATIERIASDPPGH